MNSDRKDIDNSIGAIRDDVRNGCSTIVQNTIPILEQIYSCSMDNKERNYYLHKLKEAKPSMPAICKIIDHTIEHIGNDHYQFFSTLKKNIETAEREVVDKAVEYLSGRDELKILTVSYSTKVLNVLNSLGCNLNVFAVESKWNGISYGANLKKNLNKCIISKIIFDVDINNMIDEIDCVLIGSDGFNRDGDVINGTPSLRIAQIYKNRAEILCLAESYKKSDNLRVDEGFDLIPGELIDRIITDCTFL